MSDVRSNQGLLPPSNVSKFSYPHLTDPPAVMQMAARAETPEIKAWRAKRRRAEALEAAEIRRANEKREADSTRNPVRP